MAARLSVVVAAVLAVPIASASATTTGLRDQRYCEVIPSVTQASTVTTYIYNTQGLNLCPAAQWDGLTEDEANQEFGSQSAQLNGPRHWMMDTLEGTGSSNTGQTFTFGGIEMSLRGTIVTPVGTPTVGQQFYVPNTVQRQTVYTFQARQPIYELIDPDHNVYVMQSYAQIVDPELTIDQLPALGHILSLPAGWRYRQQRPRHSIQIIATGIAHVINDNLADSYQRMTKPSLQLSGVPAGCVRQRIQGRSPGRRRYREHTGERRPPAHQAHHQQQLHGHRPGQPPLGQPTAHRRREQRRWSRSRPRVLPRMRPRVTTLDRIGLNP